jgi:hypothetical protein
MSDLSGTTKFDQIHNFQSAASFCRQVAARVPDMFCSFYLAKNHEIAYNSATTKAREKISTDLESLEKKILMYV